MTENEKKTEHISYEDQLVQAFLSLKGKPLPTDTEMFLGDMPSKMPDRFEKK